MIILFDHFFEKKNINLMQCASGGISMMRGIQTSRIETLAHAAPPVPFPLNIR